MQGKEEGYRYLYESTYQSKFYLAVKYMNRQEAAEDVLQESYAKAFSKLDTLKEPEAFPGWLGMIVANEAKNALQKNNPLRRTRTLSRMSGMYSASRITPNGAANTLESQRLSEYDFIMGSQEEQTFLEENPEAPWVVLVE